MMPSNTMPMPPWAASPMSMLPMPRNTSSPSPSAPIIDVVTHIANPISTVWLIPAMIAPEASGSSMRSRICRGRSPSARAASIRPAGTWRMPSVVMRTLGATAKNTVAITPGTLPMPTSMAIGTR